MSAATTAGSALDREFLSIRSRLIELAAALDRIQRDEGIAEGDPRHVQIRSSLDILAADSPNRAERIQMAFSLPCD